MSLTPEQLSILMRPLNPGRIKKRSQSGNQLSYLEAWDVRATLIRLFGFGGFSYDVIDTKIIDVRKGQTKAGKETDVVSVMVTGRLTIPSLDVTYTEVAASSQSGQGIGDVADFAAKTATSDALKRCAINLGTQMGLSLYNNGSTDEVVRHIVAPGQEFWNGQQQTQQQPAEQVQQLQQPGIVQNPTVHAERPAPSQEDDGTPAVLEGAEDGAQRSQERHENEMNTLRNKLGQQTGDAQ